MDGDWMGHTLEQSTATSPVASGQAVNIVRLKDDGEFELDENAIRCVFQSPDVQDKPVVVVSVAGAFRKGKSFLLNFFLRYMQNQGRDDWMGGPQTPLEGFSWRGGCERNTTGILLWDKVFLVTRSDGSQVAVLLMDTQGAFDSETTVKQVAAIFALSTLTSSVQVYNLSQNIQEDDLQHLQFFAEYGRLIQERESSEKPFQKLIFLVRDWAHLSDANYGLDGGEILLNKRFSISRPGEEQQRLRDSIKSCFSELGCFLLPYPGRQVATGQSTNGYLEDMEADFQHHIREFVSSVLAADMLLTKRINGEEISCKDWVTFFSKCAQIFKRNGLPELKSIFEVTVEANNVVAFNKAVKLYVEGMESICGENKPFTNYWDFRDHHEKQFEAALGCFASVPKMGGAVYSQPYAEQLRKELDKKYARFLAEQTKKCSSRTPLVLSATTVTSAVGVAAAVLVGGPVGAIVAVASFSAGGTSLATLFLWAAGGVNERMRTIRFYMESTMDLALESALDPTRLIHLTRIFGWHPTPKAITSHTPQGPQLPQGYRDAMLKGVETTRSGLLVRTKGDHSLELDEEALERILLADQVKDKPVVVVSVAGAFRKGKSFLLDFFIRYMRSGCKGEWMGDPNVPLEALSWRKGCESDTAGILLCDEVFLVTTTSGEQVAVLLMYTQGAFGDESTVKDSAKIFALSAMASSVQVYNVSQNIGEDDLQHLQLLHEYGRLVQKDTKTKPFQKLLFLVRDWNSLDDAGYGAEGGRSVLERRLHISKGQDKKSKELRGHIQSCFKEIRCFLMPHPGPKVATTPSFDGCLSDIEDDFKKQLQELVPSLLKPDELPVKEISGQKVTCQQLVAHLKVYVNRFMGDAKPEAMSMLEMTTEAQFLDAVANARRKYTSGMEQVCGGSHSPVNPERLELHHLQLRESARKWFSDVCDTPGDDFSQKYLDRLTEEIDRTFEIYRKRNERNIMTAAWTTATLCAMALAFYFVSCALAMVGLNTFSNLCILLSGLCLVSLCVFGYIRYSGHMQKLGAHIDTVPDVIWGRVLNPLYKTVTQDRGRLPFLLGGAGKTRTAPPSSKLKAN